MASPGGVIAPLAKNNNLRSAAMLGQENRFSAVHRLRDLWEDLSRWAAEAFWIAVLAGAVAVVKGLNMALCESGDCRLLCFRLDTTANGVVVLARLSGMAAK